MLRILLASGTISAAVSSVEMPISATMPGPILETSLPSTVCSSEWSPRQCQCYELYWDIVTVCDVQLTVDGSALDALEDGSHVVGSRCDGDVM